MNRYSWARGKRRGFRMLLLFLAALAAVGVVHAQNRITDYDRSLMRMVGEFAHASSKDKWLEEHRARITPRAVERLEQLSVMALHDNAMKFANNARWFLAFVELENRNFRKSLVHQIEANSAAFMLADTPAKYEEVRKLARVSANIARKISEPLLEFRSLVTAADASFFALTHKALKPSLKRQLELRTLNDLLEAARLAFHEESPAWVQRFVSLTGGVLRKSQSQVFYGGGREKTDPLSKALAPLLESAIPVEFEFGKLPNKTRQDNYRIARALAQLSFDYGSAPVASARLHVAAAQARDAGDLPEWADIAHMRYRGERDHGGSRVQLRRLRNDLRATFNKLRGRYRSRVGRLWAANNADELFSDLLRDQLIGGDMPAAAAFHEFESLKARLLLDQLSLKFRPLPGAAASDQIRQLDDTLLGFPKCKRTSRSLAMREMLLVSRVPIGSLWQRNDQGKGMRTLEAAYQRAGAGFQGVAEPASLRKIKSALRRDEAIIEYYIPYHPLHPARDLWILAISRDRTVMRHIPLGDKPTPGSGFIGRLSVDNCPPIDASPLSIAVSQLRIAIQSSDESRALRSLQRLYKALVRPIIKAGFDPKRFSRWIIVPHGPLHYVPFAALRGSDKRFLIEHVAITMSPSASVWLHQQHTGRKKPSNALGLLAPALADTSLPQLPSAKREEEALRAHLTGSGTRILKEKAASERALREIAPQVDLLHLSTHGNFPERYAINFHEILLAPSGADDGRLLASEIRDLDLKRTALVMLAICNGGLYSTGPSDEPYGLIPAFFAAGSGTVIGTLWPLEDAFGRDFAASLYERLLQDGPANALRRTMLRYIKEEELIRRWAGFISVGPARPYQ